MPMTDDVVFFDFQQQSVVAAEIDILTLLNRGNEMFAMYDYMANNGYMTHANIVADQIISYIDAAEVILCANVRNQELYKQLNEHQLFFQLRSFRIAKTVR